MAEKKKVLVIGASGMVGMATVEAITEYLGADVITFDRPATTQKQVEDRAKRRTDFNGIKSYGERLLDCRHAKWLLAGRTPVACTAIDIPHMDDLASAFKAEPDCIVITAGAPRKPGEDRSALLKSNSAYFTTLGEQLADAFIACGAKGAFPVVINTGNPVDDMTEVLGTVITARITGKVSHDALCQLPARIIGQGGILDGARAAFALNKQFNIALDDLVEVPVLGPHNDKMRIDFENVRVRHNGRIIALSDYPGVKLDEQTKEEIAAITRKGGADVLQDTLAKTGHSQSAVFSTATAVMLMVEAVLQDKKAHLCVAAFEPKSGFVEGRHVQLCSKGATLANENGAPLPASAALFQKAIA